MSKKVSSWSWKMGNMGKVRGDRRATGQQNVQKKVILWLKTALCCYFSQNFIFGASCGNGKKKNLSRPPASRGAPTTRRSPCCVPFCVGHSARWSRAYGGREGSRGHTVKTSCSGTACLCSVQHSWQFKVILISFKYVTKVLCINEFAGGNHPFILHLCVEVIT